MDFRDDIRGHLAQHFVGILFERGGFRVTRLGVEDLFSEIKLLNREEYLALKLPENLRALPDLLVADRELKTARLVEVKYRSRWTEPTMKELHATLTAQRKHWPDSYSIVLRGDAGARLRFHQDFIRVIPPSPTNKRFETLQALLWNQKFPEDDDDFDYPARTPEEIWGMLGTLLVFGDSPQWIDVLRMEAHITRMVKALASV